MLVCWFPNDTFKSMISFGCNKEDMARKMLQCHLLEGHSRSPLALVPQQQLTVFLFQEKISELEQNGFIQFSYHSTNQKLVQVKKYYNYEIKNRILWFNNFLFTLSRILWSLLLYISSMQFGFTISFDSEKLLQYFPINLFYLLKKNTIIRILF